jgi:hypothetical protein
MMTVQAVHPTGFTIALQVTSWEDLDTTCTDLLARGYRPTAGAGDGYARTPNGEPLCPRHSVVMRRREKQGDVWWSHPVVDPRTGEELYCRGYPDRKQSPGWEIAAPA